MHAHVCTQVCTGTHTYGMNAIIGVEVPTSIDLKQNEKSMPGTEIPF